MNLEDNFETWLHSVLGAFCYQSETAREYEWVEHTWCVQVLRSLKEAFAAAMQSWRERCEKYVCLQGDYVEKWLHFQLPVVSSFLNK